MSDSKTGVQRLDDLAHAFSGSIEQTRGGPKPDPSRGRGFSGIEWKVLEEEDKQSSFSK